MRVRKTIVRDENGKPLAVQIDYADWLSIEQRISKLDPLSTRTTRLEEHKGTIRPHVDPLTYQNSIRAEWK